MVLAVGTELAHSNAFGWAKVTAEDLGERIQAFAIAMAELVGVDGVEATMAAEMRGWHLRLLRGAVRTWVCSVGRYGDCGHDGDIAGGVELSAKTGLTIPAAPR